jgi:hypothetical protein
MATPAHLGNTVVLPSAAPQQSADPEPTAVPKPSAVAQPSTAPQPTSAASATPVPAAAPVEATVRALRPGALPDGDVDEALARRTADRDGTNG